MNKEFKSKKSIWLGILVWLPLILLFAIFYRPVFTEGNIPESILQTGIWALLFLFITTIWFGTKYIITDEQLIIKIGPVIERKIQLSELQTAERSRSLLASPSTSFRRLKICYGQHEVHIAPQNEADFLKVLEDKCPGFQIYNLTFNNTNKIW